MPTVTGKAKLQTRNLSRGKDITNLALEVGGVKRNYANVCFEYITTCIVSFSRNCHLHLKSTTPKTILRACKWSTCILVRIDMSFIRQPNTMALFRATPILSEATHWDDSLDDETMMNILDKEEAWLCADEAAMIREAERVESAMIQKEAEQARTSKMPRQGEEYWTYISDCFSPVDRWPDDILIRFWKEPKYSDRLKIMTFAWVNGFSPQNIIAWYKILGFLNDSREKHFLSIVKTLESGEKDCTW